MTHHTRSRIPITLLLLAAAIFLPFTAMGQPKFRIAMLKSPSGFSKLAQQVVEETQALLGHRYTLVFSSHNFDADQVDPARFLDDIMADPAVDCVLALSMETSAALGQRKSFPKPSIAALVLDPRLQGFPITADGNSGVPNFTYIEPPFDIAKDLRTFDRLVDFRHLGVLIAPHDIRFFADAYSFFGKQLGAVDPKAHFSFIEVDPTDIAASIDAIGSEVDAIYLTPVLMDSHRDVQTDLIRRINRRGLPSFAFMGEESVRQGAMAAIAPSTNRDMLSRRIALNLMKIAEGRDPAGLNVRVEIYSDNFVVNVATIDAIGVCPDWQVLSDARLIQVDQQRTGRQLTLQLLIAEALRQNLDLKLAELNTSAQREEVGIARGGLLPQVSLQTTFTQLDAERADGQPGSPAPQTWIGSGTISQPVYVDDIWANYEIQKILTEAQIHQQKTEALDTVLLAAEGFIELLLANSNYKIQNDNLDVTHKNLEISVNKQAVGQVGALDVYRWQSQLAQNKISRNDAYRDVQVAKMRLNQIIDRPIDQPFYARDITPDTSLPLLVNDPKVWPYIENKTNMKKIARFLIAEADRNLPELKQIAATIRSQQRLVLNAQRAYYIPDIQISGQLDKILGEYDTRYETPAELDHPWSISALASWPLFDGSQRRHTLARERLGLESSQVQQRDLKNQLDLLVYSNLETAWVSAREIELAEQALTAGRKNFEIVQDAYRQGTTGVSDLIDAQNAMTAAEQAVAVANYQFLLDLLSLERAIGYYHFLASTAERGAFYRRLEDFMNPSQVHSSSGRIELK